MQRELQEPLAACARTYPPHLQQMKQEGQNCHQESSKASNHLPMMHQEQVQQDQWIVHQGSSKA